jgi:K+-transporting ATPase c subunit
MKKGKRFGKIQVALAVLVIALGAAVWLNMRYTATQGDKQTDTSSKYLGQAEYVNAEVSEKEEKEEDSFTKLKNERKKALEQALDAVEETLKKEGLTDAQKAAAAEQAAAVSRRVEQENAVETLLSAKGFSKVLVIIGEKDVNVVVEKKPDMAAIAQIRDAVASKTDFNASDVKIISAEQ